ncbi:MAG: PrpF domain-containing protein, partial [Pseudomonadota bacterium]
RDDLPKNMDQLQDVLLAIIGSGNPLNIDGIGGGDSLTNKVAILSHSDDGWADIDYFFAQVGVNECVVDFKATCGNIMSAVGASAIEMGLIKPQAEITEIKVKAVNTGAKICIKTPTSKTQKDHLCIDYIKDSKPGQGQMSGALAVSMQMMDVAGAKTNRLFPTGHKIDKIDDLEVTCLDVAVPMVIARAVDFGLSGLESKAEIDQNKAFIDHMLSIRIKAGMLMGMGDCTKSVMPKFALLTPHPKAGHIIIRYFVPWQTHPSVALTGGQCLACCVLIDGTISDNIYKKPKIYSHKASNIAKVTLHHPSGHMDVNIEYAIKNNNFIHQSSYLSQTIRKIASGYVFIASYIWP